MISSKLEKNIAIKLNDSLIQQIDMLAKGGGLARSQLMLSFVNIWLNVLDNSQLPHIFYAANILRVHDYQLSGEFGVYEHEFSALGIPEKPIPIKLSEADIINISGYSNKCHISRHQVLKTMVIVGIEELLRLVGNQPYQYGEVEPKLHKIFSTIMKKGFKAFEAYRK
jgi:hypothetical protein